jgi:Ca-activated chloride channel family protein
VQPKDVCFVVDTSGSMAGPKMEQARKALLFCLANLNAGDRFDIIRFSTEAEPLHGKLVDASDENVKKAYAFVRDLKPRGGTAIADAMQRALEAQNRDPSRPYVVIFLTDGQPTIGETNPDRIVERVKTSGMPRVFSFGIGTDINTHLLDRIANATRAVSQYVLPDEDIEVKVSSFYTKIQSPVLSDVRLAVNNESGIRVSQVYPSVLPDLFKGETLMAFGRYTGSGRATVRVSGTLNGQPTEFVADVNFAEHETDHAYIPRLWATRRVGWLLEEIRLNGESRELKDEVVRLAREHGIVTPYTAYLILEDERVRNVPVAMRTMREMEADRLVAADVARQYEAREQAAGPQAVNDSLTLQRMKMGYNEAQVQTGAAGMTKQAPATLPVGSTGYKVAQNYGQQVRVLKGRAFYQNGSTWTDAQVQTKKDLNRREVAFNGDDYFALLRAHPDAAPWLSLGNEVDVVIGETLYVIR